MDMFEIIKMEIVGIKKTAFECSMCNNHFSIKYEVKINEINESKHHICLRCHNTIAEKLYSKTKKRCYKY